MTTQGEFAICPYKVNASHERLYGETKRKLAPIARMSDERIIGLSIAQAEFDAKKSKTAKVLSVLPKALLASCVAIAACSTPGALSKKIASGAATAGIFAGAHVVLKGCDKLYKKISKKTKAKHGEPQGNPYIRATGRLLGSLAAIGLAFAGVKQGLNLFAKTNAAKTVEALKETVEKSIDSTRVAGKVDELRKGYQKFIGNHPGIHKNIIGNAFPATLLGYVGASIGLSSKLNQKTMDYAAQNIENLAEARDEARAGLFLIEMAKDYEPKSDLACDKLRKGAKKECKAAKAEIEEIENKTAKTEKDKID